MDSTAKPTFEMLKSRIEQSDRYYSGSMPQEAAVAWRGYLGGLVEWALLTEFDHDVLAGLLPSTGSSFPDAVDQILLQMERPDDLRGE